ncbi:hypothetical protein EB615_19025 [Escherichia coli]|nr:hypothetical protein [Escherichia coli]EFN8173824.1 hypothetical protein [Escherichia coli]EFN9879928.1 hypothetical protein [Escherichia coli]RBW97176.1 hypothetical protein DS969_22075 [Escherichia coli]RBX10730.1 hypothetical protein DS980_21915 [Escherichia coli]
MCWGVTLCVITTRSNLFGFKENGQGGDTLPVFFCRHAMLAHLIQPKCAERIVGPISLRIGQWLRKRQQYRIRLPRNSLMPFAQVLNHRR